MSQAALFNVDDSDSMTIAQVAMQLNVSEASVRNWIKTSYLTSVYSGQVTRESFNQFKESIAGTEKLTRRANKLHRNSHDHVELCDRITATIKTRCSELDGESLAAEYENSLSTSYKNKEGVYYTPAHIAQSFFKQISVDFDTATFCDPCCGTGNFLVAALKAGFRPSNIYGFDIDETAVEIARLRLRELAGQDVAHIEHRDFLADVPMVGDHQLFDVIVTNPPWGKKLTKDAKETLAKRFHTKMSADSSSIFYFACHRATKPLGFIGLLLPESFFNIGTFQDTREHLLLNTIVSLHDFGKPFKGLVTKAQGFISQKLSPKSGSTVKCVVEGNTYERPQQAFSSNPGKIINLNCTEEENAVIAQIYSFPHITLRHQAKWGLGIVTGNNSKFCQTQPKDGYMPVFRGEDITVDGLEPPSCFIPADLSLYQQVAPVGLYRAQEKLLYRFIANSLVFHCDREQSFCLNSANIVVLNDSFPVSHSAVARLLNSETVNWLYRKLFNTHKVLRSNLEVLPIFHEFLKSYGDSFEEGELQAYLKVEEDNGTFRTKE